MPSTPNKVGHITKKVGEITKKVETNVNDHYGRFNNEVTNRFGDPGIAIAYIIFGFLLAILMYKCIKCCKERQKRRENNDNEYDKVSTNDDNNQDRNALL